MEEQYFQMAEIANAIRNAPDYSLERILSNEQNGRSMSLFRLGTNRSFDASLPVADATREGGNESGSFYVFFLSSQDKGISYFCRYVADFSEILFFHREIDAVAWALARYEAEEASIAE